MKGVYGGAMLVAAVAAAAPVWAESPMSPVRPLTAPGAARQWVEPPPAPPAPMPPSSVAADTATAGEPASQAEDKRPARSPERSARAGRNSTASRLNRQELGRIRSGAPYYPGYYRGYGYGYGYGPSPHSSSGD